MASYILKASTRDTKQTSNALFKEGAIPAVVYGPDFESQVISVSEKEFKKIFHDAGTSQVITLETNGKSIPTLVHEIQKEPLNERIVHIDFYHITKGHKVSVAVPLLLVGVSLGVKDKSGTLVTHVHEIEVQGLPEKLPASLEVDISSLEDFGDEIKVSSLKLPEGIEALTDADTVIVSLLAPARQEEEVKPAEAETPAQPSTPAPSEEK